MKFGRFKGPGWYIGVKRIIEDAPRTFPDGSRTQHTYVGEISFASSKEMFDQIADRWHGSSGPFDTVEEAMKLATSTFQIILIGKMG